ncbi:MAG: chemotaxis protein CheX [Syntrophomonadaceae bacterium]|nr:chemotaxis protein CheX [Syntrophomonadaceae bacterium]MDD3024775.1 chemotaxis protein CheX [Syntrophomonadaceae bacterium]
MDIKFINPFVSGLLNVSNMLGLGGMQRTGVSKREKLQTDHDVNIIIGLVGGLQGNIVFSMHESTACNIASTMMGGLPVSQFDLMPRSALCEMANMIAGNSVSNLEQMGSLVDITPPTLVSGKNMISLISQVETLVLQFNAKEGALEMNIAIEG